ncbi:MAG: hypothetical protein JWQ14_82 [Adhaeribacter sp.]|nr:hypothetical protein [Adhaeribacter sp.]
METPVSEDIEEKIKLDSFGARTHVVVLRKERFAFDTTEIRVPAITHFKFGIKIMQIGMFPVGRRYQINIKTPEKQINLVFRTYLGIGNNYFNWLFEALVDGIWLQIGERLFREAMDLVRAGKAYAVGNCTINRQGIILNQDTPLTKKLHVIPWADVSYEKKYNRLVINSKSNHQVWANLYFLDDWNVDVLMDILDWLLQEGGLAELENINP